MARLGAFGPVIPRPPAREILRAAAGSAIGLAIAGWIELSMGLSPSFLAPLGATTVLVFAVPNSPLAQPWSSVAGSIAAALVAIPAALWLPLPWAAPAAVGAAILVMSALRALHPPGGAVALLTAISLSPDRPFALLPPLIVGTVTLVAVAMAWARLTGRFYPMRSADAPGPAVARIGLHRAELEALLDRFRQGPNLGAADLGRLLAAAEAEVALHRFDGTTCGDVMTRPLISVPPTAGFDEMARLFAGNRIKSLPVVDPRGALVGIVQQGDLVRAASQRHAALSSVVARDVMGPPAEQVPADLPVGALLERLAVQGAQVVAVTEGARVVGVITRSDVIGLLLRDHVRRREQA